MQQSHELATAELAAVEDKLWHAHMALRKAQAAQPTQGGYYFAAAPTRGAIRSVSPGGSTRTSPERVAARDGSISPPVGGGSSSAAATARGASSSQSGSGREMAMKPGVSAVEGLFEKTVQKVRRVSAGGVQGGLLDRSPGASLQAPLGPDPSMDSSMLVQSSMGDEPRAPRRTKCARNSSSGHRRRANK